MRPGGGGSLVSALAARRLRVGAGDCFLNSVAGSKHIPLCASAVQPSIPSPFPRLVGHMKQHFRDDERGKRAAFYFLPWHFNFFSRYR